MHLRPLREGVILGVLDHGKIECTAVLERPPHDRAGRHTTSIVRNGNRPAISEIRHLGKLDPFLSDGNGADRMKSRTRHGATTGDEALRDSARIVDRLGVRHCADMRETAGRRSGEAGTQVFFVLVAGIAQVRVKVDKGGKQEFSPSVHHLGVLRAAKVLSRGAHAYPEDSTVVDHDIDSGVQRAGWIDGAGADHKQELWRLGHRRTDLAPMRCRVDGPRKPSRAPGIGLNIARRCPRPAQNRSHPTT